MVTFNSNGESSNDKKIIADGGNKNVDHNLNVVDEVELSELVNAEREETSECLYLFPEFSERRLHVFRNIGEVGEGKVLKHTLENVRFRLNYEGNREVRNWTIQGFDADTLLTFFNSLKWERSEANLTINWYKRGGGPMMDDEKTSVETFHIEYKTESGNEQGVHLSNEWQKPVHRFVHFQ